MDTLNLKDVTVLKLIRAAVIALVVVVSIWLAMPGLLVDETVNENMTAEETASFVPVPTPDYGEIAPKATQTPSPTVTAKKSTVTPAPVGPSEERASEYVLDLWLDGSPNVAGISPFDDKYGLRSTYGQWAGGFLYTAKSRDGRRNTVEEQGWLVSLLNMLYDKEIAGQGSVRILRFCAESMLTQAQQEELARTYSLDMDALIRDTLTYHVLRNNSDNHSAFFKSLLKTKGDMDPGGNNPYETQDCFYMPNRAKINNRTVADPEEDDQSEWNWQREITDPTALAHADVMIDNAIQGYHTQLRDAAERSAASPTEDYLYYALSAMDPSHLNVMVVDTLGLPEIDQPELYAQLISDMSARIGSNLSVGQMVFQLDYAGKISSIGGRSLPNGLLWGFENFRWSGEFRKGSLKWNYMQPMPRALLMLLIGPSELVDSYTEIMCQRLDREMENGGVFSAKRGDPSIMVKDPDSYEAFNTFQFGGESYTSPVFGFKYRCTVMESKDVVDEQSTLMSLLSQRLTENDAALTFVSDGEVLETQEYLYRTTLGNAVSEYNVPVITTDFGESLTLSLNLGLTADDAFTVAEGQYDSAITVVSALETQSFTLDEIDALSRGGELDLSEDSAILRDQAYVDQGNRIYKYHVTNGASLQLEATTPAVIDSELQLTLSSTEVPLPGYYWITLEMRSEALAELDNASWNSIEPWMQSDTEALSFDISQGPAVLSDFGSSWDYSPNSYDLNSYIDIDARLTSNDKKQLSIAPADGTRAKMIHHAWGASNENVTDSNPNDAFPADVPPVFRLFQFNRIASSIRNGLLDRSGEIDSAPFLTRHFIVCVPEPTNAGE